MEAEALDFQFSGNVPFGGDLSACTGVLGKLVRSSVTDLVCEFACRDRDRVGDGSDRSLAVLRLSTRAESRRRSQKGLVKQGWWRMRVLSCALKDPVVVQTSSSSDRGAVEGATWTLLRLLSCSWALRWMSRAALEVSGEAMECAGLSRTARGLLLLLGRALPVWPGLCFVFAGLVHGFFQPLSKGPLSPAVRMTGGRPRRYWAAMASTLLRLAACCSGPWRSRGGCSMTSWGQRYRSSEATARLRWGCRLGGILQRRGLATCI
jgi:hypothetical protein